MSTFYGYGFRFDEEINPTKFLDFLKGYPKDYKAYQKYLKGIGDEENNDTALEWITNYFSERFCGYGLPAYFCQKVSEEEGIEFYCDGYTIIFPEKILWGYNEKERGLSRADVDDVFDKWIEKISDDIVVYDELSIDD